MEKKAGNSPETEKEKSKLAALSELEIGQVKRSGKKKTNKDAFHKMEFLEDVPMRMFVEIARKELPLREILQWKNESVVEFEKIVGEHLDLLIGDQLLARGEVVVINDHFGIRISEICRPDEKLKKSMDF